MIYLQEHRGGLKDALKCAGKRNVKQARKDYADLRKKHSAEEVAFEAMVGVRSHTILGNKGIAFSYGVIGLLASIEMKETKQAETEG